MRLFWLSAGWLGGIALGSVVPLSAWAWAGIGLVAASGAALFRRWPRALTLLLPAAFAAFGAARLALAKPAFGPRHVVHLNDSPAIFALTGVVVDSPDIRDTYTGLRLRVQTVRLPEEDTERRAEGLVLIRAPRHETWAYGDRIEAAGRLEAPPVFETFSYRDYLARQGIHSLLSPKEVRRLAVRQANPILQSIYSYRGSAERTLRRLFPDPEASLLTGILLGAEGRIPPAVRKAFNATGTSHIIAISGFNITLIAGVMMRVFGSWLGPRRGGLAAGAAIAVYTLLAGADAAVVRAAIMGGLTLLAQRLGRQTFAMASLGATALLMTLVNPYTLWDVGFELSFGATLGLVLYAEPLKAWFLRAASRWGPERAARLAGPVGEYFLFTLAAQATTLPLTVFYFNRLSLVSLVANPFILPLQPAVMIMGGAALLAGSLWEPLGQPLAWIAWPFVTLTIRLVELFASCPAATFSLGRLSPLTALVLYALLFGLTALVRLPPDRRPRLALPALPASLALTSLAVMTGLAWRAAADRPDGRLHITFFDVGFGNAALIESPTGRFVLVDGGPSGVALSEALGRRLPLLGRQVDWAVLAATGDEHVAGLAGVAEQFPIQALLVAGPPGDRAYRILLETMNASTTPIVDAVTGAALDLGSGAVLEIVARGDHGAVAMIRYGHFRLLLASGADPELTAELARLRSVAEVTAVLLADGGSLAANPPEWLISLRPWVAVISVDAGNRSGLPSAEVLQTLNGTTVLRTDRNGWIRAITDGEQIWFEVERR